MNKNFGVFFAFILVFFLVSSYLVNSLSIEFIDPTPENATSNSSIYINTSHDATGDSYSFLAFDNDVLGWYSFDSYDGTNVFDLLGSNHMTYSGMASQSDIQSGGVFGDKMFNSSATSGKLVIPDAAVPENNFSVSFWFKKDGTPASHEWIFKRTDGYPAVRVLSSGSVCLYFAALTYSCDAVSIFDGEWHHISISMKESMVPADEWMWVDGVVDTLGTTMSLDFSTGTWDLGGNLVNNQQIDELIIFNRTLTTAESQALYNSTANNYEKNFTTSLIFGEDNTYQAYIVNSTGDNASTELRTLSRAGTLFINNPYSGAGYVTNITLNVTTDFMADCDYSLDGAANVSMGTTDNLDHNITVEPSEGNHNVVFYCSNDTLGVSESESVNFNMTDHMVMYVDKDHADCSNDYSRQEATSENYPYCTIAKGVAVAEAGDEFIIKNGTYGEKLWPTTSGTADNPIVFRGESNTLRTTLDGTSVGADTSGIRPSAAYNEIKYFYVTNFSTDCIASSSNTYSGTHGLLIENITCHENGYEGDGVEGGAAGDGVSFHLNSTGTMRWLNLTSQYKSGIVDINGARTNYSNIYINDSEDYGVWFYSSTYDRSLQSHWINDIVVENSPYCLKSNVHVNANGLTCNSNGNGIFANYSQVIIQDTPGNISNFIINNTPLNVDSILVEKSSDIGNTPTIAYFIDGYFDANISLIESCNATLINVSYDGEEEVAAGSLLNVYEYLDVSANLEGVNISITNSSGDVTYTALTDSNGDVDQQTLLNHINDGGTVTYYSNYTITATKSGYTSQSIDVNLTSYSLTNFTMVTEEVETSSGSSPGSSSGSSPVYYPSSGNLNQGYSVSLGEGWKVLINFEDEKYYFLVQEIDNRSVLFKIEPTGKGKVLEQNESYKIDLDEDGYYDLSVNVISVSDWRASVELSFISEAVPIQKVTDSSCEGCLLDEKCYPYYHRRNDSYCDVELDNWVYYSTDGEGCYDDYMCKSDLCVNEKCRSKEIIWMFLNWLMDLFSWNQPESSEVSIAKVAVSINPPTANSS